MRSPCSRRSIISTIFFQFVAVMFKLVYSQFFTEPSDFPIFRASHLNDFPCFFNFALMSDLKVACIFESEEWMCISWLIVTMCFTESNIKCHK